jgi:hypothetical protein
MTHPATIPQPIAQPGDPARTYTGRYQVSGGVIVSGSLTQTS